MQWTYKLLVVSRVVVNYDCDCIYYLWLIVDWDTTPIRKTTGWLGYYGYYVWYNNYVWLKCRVGTLTIICRSHERTRFTFLFHEWTKLLIHNMIIACWSMSGSCIYSCDHMGYVLCIDWFKMFWFGVYAMLWPMIYVL